MKALTFLLFLAASGLGGWAWWERTERLRLEEELGVVRTERDRFAKTARTKTGLIAGMEMKEDGPRGLKDLGIPLESEEDGKPEKPSVKKPGEKDTSGEPAAGTANLQDPAARELQRAQAEAQIELEYQSILEDLKLDRAAQAAVLEVLRERAGRRMELGFRTMDFSLPKAERHAAVTELGAALDRADARLREVLGSGWEKFEKFDRSAPERRILTQFEELLKENALSLEPGLRAKLLDAMYETRRAFRFEHDLQDVSRLIPESVTDRMVDRYLEQNGVLQQEVQIKVKDLMSPDQLAQFVKAQEGQQQAAQSSLGIWRRLSRNALSAEGRD